jgi:hypothetical protein
MPADGNCAFDLGSSNRVVEVIESEPEIAGGITDISCDLKLWIGRLMECSCCISTIPEERY